MGRTFESPEDMRRYALTIIRNAHIDYARSKKRRQDHTDPRPLDAVQENDAQLAATLDYIAKWADTLEGMRRHEAEQNGGVFPTLAAGPLHEIRANLEAARAFAHAGSESPLLVANSPGRHAVGAI